MSHWDDLVEASLNVARTYRMVKISDGTVSDLETVAANALSAQGWFRLCEVGTTANRPITGITDGHRYYDTDLSALVTWVGSNAPVGQHLVGRWVDATGAAS